MADGMSKQKLAWGNRARVRKDRSGPAPQRSAISWAEETELWEGEALAAEADQESEALVASVHWTPQMPPRTPIPRGRPPRKKKPVGTAERYPPTIAEDAFVPEDDRTFDDDSQISAEHQLAMQELGGSLMHLYHDLRTKSSEEIARGTFATALQQLDEAERIMFMQQFQAAAKRSASNNDSWRCL